MRLSGNLSQKKLFIFLQGLGPAFALGRGGGATANTGRGPASHKHQVLCTLKHLMLSLARSLRVDAVLRRGRRGRGDRVRSSLARTGQGPINEICLPCVFDDWHSFTGSSLPEQTATPVASRVEAFGIVMSALCRVF